jgi:hypothetical protein
LENGYLYYAHSTCLTNYSFLLKKQASIKSMGFAMWNYGLEGVP